MTALSATISGETEKSNLDITEKTLFFFTNTNTYRDRNPHDVLMHTHRGAEKILMMFDCKVQLLTARLSLAS